MRKIKTIEVDLYEEVNVNGSKRYKQVGMLSPKEIFSQLKKHLEQNNLLPDEYFLSKDRYWNESTQMPQYSKAECVVDYGDNEGIYLDIVMVYLDEDKSIKRFPFATGKTLGESGNDYLRMSRIAAECDLMLNGRGKVIEVIEEPNKTETALIQTLIQYGLENAWGDKETIDALVELGITQEDFKEAGYGEFVKDYFSDNQQNNANSKLLSGEVMQCDER